MRLIKTKIKGVFVIKHNSFKDKRGSFTRLFCEDILKKKVKFNIKQSNISKNRKKYTLRGFHYQIGKYSENKIIRCLKGGIFDIIVDLRKNSKTYAKYVSIKLNHKSNTSIIIPKGCANAFLTLVDNTEVLYYTSNFYNKNFEKGIRYNDPFFKFKWPIEPNVISKKDKKYNNYK